MGLNTVVVILNDHLHRIRDDPEFGRKLADAIEAYPSDRYHSSTSFRVVSMAHADYEQIVSVHGNIGAPVDSDARNAVRRIVRKSRKPRKS